jgi:hypothetical protein
MIRTPLSGLPAGSSRNVGYPAEPWAATCRFKPMPLYRITVRNGHYGYEDPDGAELTNDQAALQEALLIIHDLKKNNVSGWKGWTIEVTDGDRQVWQISFIGAQ